MSSNVPWYKLSAARRGYDRRWRKARKLFLAQPGNELCVLCRERGRVVPSEVVDHIVPHRGDKRLFWDRSNWQALCSLCNKQKTSKESGGLLKGCRPDGSPIDPDHPWHKGEGASE